MKKISFFGLELRIFMSKTTTGIQKSSHLRTVIYLRIDFPNFATNGTPCMYPSNILPSCLLVQYLFHI